jgi:hypothetical protein
VYVNFLQQFQKLETIFREILDSTALKEKLAVPRTTVSAAPPDRRASAPEQPSRQPVPGHRAPTQLDEKAEDRQQLQQEMERLKSQLQR